MCGWARGKRGRGGTTSDTGDKYEHRQLVRSRLNIINQKVDITQKATTMKSTECEAGRDTAILKAGVHTGEQH